MNLRLGNIDRRVIYAFVVLALSVPLLLEYSVPPAQMEAADTLYEVVEGLEPDKNSVALVAFDFGPNTKAENQPQAEVVIEHLMRRRIPVGVFSLYSLAEPFLKTVPQEIASRLEKEFPNEKWVYGVDWVDLGYRPGWSIFVQNLAKSENLVETFLRDSKGNALKDLPAFKNVRTLRDVIFFGEFTGLSGAFDTYVQFFRTKDYKPKFGHGCTSITIPEAFIYVDSGQLDGLLEGIAGAAWYSQRLKDAFPNRPTDSSAVLNTSLGVAHLVIIFFILLGNAAVFFKPKKKRSGGRA